MKHAFVTVALFFFGQAFSAQALTDSVVRRLAWDQNLNQQVSLNLTFLDERNTPVTLKQCLGGKPAILVLGYYECPMLCNLVLNGTVESLQEIKPTADLGEQLVFVSIDPRETPKLAAQKKATYLKRFARPDAQARWHFLCGSEPNVQALANQVGFHYAYDQQRKEYAHPSGIIILTPGGKISRYFFGVSFPAAELHQALSDASVSKTGSAIQAFVILCSHFVPLTGKFSGTVMASMRILAVGTILFIAGVVAFSARRDRSKVQTGKDLPS